MVAFLDLFGGLSDMSFNNFRLGISVKWQAFVFSIFVIQILALPPACKNACDCASAFSLEAAA